MNLRRPVTILMLTGAALAAAGWCIRLPQAGNRVLLQASVERRALSRLVPIRMSHYRHEIAVQSRQGYGNVSTGFWRSNGYDEDVRALYAAGFFFTGLDASELGKPAAARYWLECARAYASDRLIERALRRLSSARTWSHAISG